MADLEDLYDDDGELDWLYVEDHYDDADDLAEHAVPSPPAEYDNGEDYDPYAYFEDLAYLSDSYYDSTRPPRRDSNNRNTNSTASAPRTNGTNGTSASPRKRKRSANASPHPKQAKPAQAQASAESTPPVLWRSRRADEATSAAPTVQLGSRPTVALLPDWASRFEGVRGLGRTTQGERNTASAVADNAADTEAGPEADADADEAANPIDPASMDLSAVASLLDDQTMAQLRATMAARGLDPEAVEVVLGDLLAGREPEFDEDDGGEVDDGDGADHRNEDGADGGDDDDDDGAAAAPPPAKRTRTAPKRQREPPTPAPAPAQLPRRGKRKAPASASASASGDQDDGINDDTDGDGSKTHSARPGRSKRVKASAGPALREGGRQSAPASGAGETAVKTTRSGRRRK